MSNKRGHSTPYRTRYRQDNKGGHARAATATHDARRTSRLRLPKI